MMKSGKLALFAMLTFMAFFAGCGGSGGGDSSGSSGGTGTLSVGLTDSTEDLYRAVYVTINEVQVCTNNNGGASEANSSTADPSNDVVPEENSSNNGCVWQTLAPPDNIQFPKTYNLLKLVNGVTETIAKEEFSAGQYNQVRLIIGDSPESENNLLGVPHPAANYVILNDGSDTVEPLKIPSGFQTGIKLVHPFTVEAGQTKELVLDFIASKSVHKAGNSGKYILKPTIKVIETESKVDIDGKVTDDADTPRPITGAMISAQISDGLSATVVRSTTSESDTNSENGLEEGEYRLTYLSPDQIYNIVAYAEGNAPACKAFRYNEQYSELPLDFQLSASDTATVSGTVTVDGPIDADFALRITIYTQLDCNHPDGEGYVEIAATDGAQSADGGNSFEYSITLPKYASPDPTTYYVVASADGYAPATVEVGIYDIDTDVSGVDLTLIAGQ